MILKLFYILTLLFLAINIVFAKGKAGCELSPIGVYVVLSSEADITEDENEDREVFRWVQIAWWGMDIGIGDTYVAIWDHEPGQNEVNTYLDYTTINSIDGTYTTYLRWNSTEFPSDIDSASECLPFWAGYILNATVMYQSCLKFEPRWMTLNKIYIENVGIADVLLPGSHDAGAYDGVHLLGGNEVSKWTVTQDESLWQQFVTGVRYVDMRISYYDNTDEKFWVNHGDVRIRPLDGYINDVVRFLNETEEILIFDIHEFSTGYNETTSEALIDLLEHSFSDWMAPSSMGSNPLLSELWNLDKRILVTYPHDIYRNSSDFLWERVQHVWGNVNELDDLYNYMNESIPNYFGNGTMWSLMTEFTPTALDVTLRKWNGLRGAANVTNEPVTQWLRREWWTSANVVAMDFGASSDIVDVIIEANRVRYECGGNV